MDGLSLDQVVGFVALTFRSTYLTYARRVFPELEAELPLARGAALTVVQVNGGEALHFLLAPAPRRVDATCRHATIVAPEGWSLADWARIAEGAYLRFVERAAGVSHPEAHFVLFPEDDPHLVAAAAAERAVRSHVGALRPRV